MFESEIECAPIGEKRGWLGALRVGTNTHFLSPRPVRAELHRRPGQGFFQALEKRLFQNVSRAALSHCQSKEPFRNSETLRPQESSWNRAPSFLGLPEADYLPLNALIRSAVSWSRSMALGPMNSSGSSTFLLRRRLGGRTGRGGSTHSNSSSMYTTVPSGLMIE